MAAAGDHVRADTRQESESLTAIGHLARVAARAPVSELGKGWSDFLQALERGAPSGTFVLGQGDLDHFTRLGVLDFGRDGDDLLVEPAGLLSTFGTGKRLGGISILHLAGDVKILANVFRRLSHGLHAIGRLLVGQDFWVEGLGRAVASGTHQLRADSQPDLDAAGGDLGGDVLHRLEARRAEAVDGRSGSGVGEASRQAGSPHERRGVSIVDLHSLDQRLVDRCPGGRLTLPRQMSSTSCGSSFDFWLTVFSSERSR